MADTEFQDERLAIERLFETEWAGLTPVKYENTEFDQPEATPWVELIIAPGGGEQVDIGTSNPRFRYVGTIIVAVHVKQNSGLAASSEAALSAERLAGKASDIFRARQFASGAKGTITTRVPRKVNAGPDIYGWYNINLSVGFYRDQTA
jgi:hypothetical protein